MAATPAPKRAQRIISTKKSVRPRSKRKEKFPTLAKLPHLGIADQACVFEFQGVVGETQLAPTKPISAAESVSIAVEQLVDRLGTLSSHIEAIGGYLDGGGCQITEGATELDPPGFLPRLARRLETAHRYLDELDSSVARIRASL